MFQIPKFTIFVPVVDMYKWRNFMKLLIPDGCVDSVNALSSFLELSGLEIDKACLLETPSGSTCWMLTLAAGADQITLPHKSLKNQM